MPYKDKARHNEKQREYRRKRREGQKAAPPAGPEPGQQLGDVVADWAEARLKVPTGPLRGQPFRNAPWQRAFLVQALGPGIREAGLSVARKNGKSGLIAALLLAYLVGPLNRPMWRAVVVSLTGILASELRDAIQQTAEVSGLDGSLTVKRSPPPGSIEGLAGSRVTVLASDKAAGHSLGADLAIVDEAGLIGEARRDLWAAVMSSISGRDGRLLAISIKGDGPMFKELGERADDPTVVWHEYQAAPDAALDDEAAWAAANPGLADGIKSIGYMRDAARKAISVSADAASFRAYDLNLPRSPSTETICSAAEWTACEREELPERAGPCCVGFDIGGSVSLTALAAFWPDTGRLEAWAACGDTPDLLERSRADGQGDLYCQMAARGELQVYPGRVTPAGDFLLNCLDALRDAKIVSAGADRYRRAEVTEVLEKAGIRWPVVWRGQGAAATADGSHDVRSFQRLVLGNRLAVRESLVMRSAIAESVVRYDAAGNPALDKRRAQSRIDALSACVIAAGLGEIEAARPKRRGIVGVVR